MRWQSLDFQEPLGPGTVGEFYRALWNSKEVAVKCLINQKVNEDDILEMVSNTVILRYEILYLLTMCSVSQFYLVVLVIQTFFHTMVFAWKKIVSHNLTKPIKIFYYLIVFVDLAIVTEFASHGNLRALLSDESIPLPLARRLRMAKEIAAGMTFLSMHPDPVLRVHDNFKSHNIMVADDWTIKIADFGQASVKDLCRTMTSVTNVAWTGLSFYYYYYLFLLIGNFNFILTFCCSTRGTGRRAFE